MITVNATKAMSIEFSANLFANKARDFKITLAISDGSREVKWISKNNKSFELTPFNGFFEEGAKCKMKIAVEFENSIAAIAEYKCVVTSKKAIVKAASGDKVNVSSAQDEISDKVNQAMQDAAPPAATEPSDTNDNNAKLTAFFNQQFQRAQL